MLVLTRKKLEKLQIGDHITVTILRIRGQAVQLGIEAPPQVKILRAEIAFEPPAAVSAGRWPSLAPFDAATPPAG